MDSKRWSSSPLYSFSVIFSFILLYLGPQGVEECHDVVKTHIQEKPEEECTLEPVKTCKHITRLVPKLVEVQECVDVPKEICNRSKQNPRKVKKPIIKNWCYTPAENDDLQNL